MIILTRRSLLAGTSALAAASLAPSFGAYAAARTYRALLVACTDYPNLPKRNWLIGPKHDAGLVRDYLLKNAPVAFAPENVTLLAQDVEGAGGLPTHAAITAALADIASKVQRDDFVYLHLSGHGAQQPQRRQGDETDGLDEIFLPVDIEKWVDRESGVPNALVDDEIGAALDAIRDKGAFIWAVFDCCHSGTATRAAEVDDEMERKIEFADLVGGDDAAKAAAQKVYDGVVATAASRDVGDDTGPRKPAFNLTPTGAEPIAKGKLVAFYAAQTIETTPEMPLPRGVEDATRFGLFTFTIMAKLAENPNVTYRQLGQAILQQYTADGRTRPTPLFEGELDARVFGTEKSDAVNQWPITVKGESVTINAGRLQRLAPGSKLAILPSALSTLDQAAGYLEVSSAKNLESRLKPVAYDDKPALKVADIPANAYARVAELAVDYKLAVARPAPTAGLEKETGLVNSVLDELAAAKDSGISIALVEPGKGADLRLAVLREDAIAGAAANATDRPALWFLPASGDVTTTNGARPPLIVIHPDDRAKLLEATKKNLTTIFRATGLSRLAAASDYRPEEVDVVFQLKRDGADALEPLEASSVPRASPGDQVHVKAVNNSANLVDLNVLYVGSDYSITHIVAERLTSQATLEEGLLQFTDSSFGMERMIAVLTEAPPQSEKEDLSFLAQDGVPSATRGVGGGFSDMLADIGMAPATRSVMKLSGDKGPKGAVMIFPVETVPRA